MRAPSCYQNSSCRLFRALRADIDRCVFMGGRDLTLLDLGNGRKCKAGPSAESRYCRCGVCQGGESIWPCGGNQDGLSAGNCRACRGRGPRLIEKCPPLASSRPFQLISLSCNDGTPCRSYWDPRAETQPRHIATPPNETGMVRPCGSLTWYLDHSCRQRRSAPSKRYSDIVLRAERCSYS
jgi:hypothetical protein